MSLTHTDEVKLIQDVERLRTQFPQTKELYREVCRLMFFRYGMQPTANKLYQLVRKGTMATPSQAVNHFWSELRDKKRLDVEHPGLPDSLREFASEALSALWKGALEVAKQHYQSKQVEVDGNHHANQHALEQYRSQLKVLEERYALQQRDLDNARKQLQDEEKRRLIDNQMLATHKESLVTLQNEKAALEGALKNISDQFNADINKLHAAIKLADDRYHKLESKAAVELDRERQRAYKCEVEISELKKALSREHAAMKSQTLKNQKLVNELSQNISLIKAQLKDSQRQQLMASNKLKQIERKKMLLK